MTEFMKQNTTKCRGSQKYRSKTAAHRSYIEKQE